MGRTEAGDPAQIALAWLMAQKPWIVPIPGSTQMPHMLENISAASVRFTLAELTELNAAASTIETRGARLPDRSWSFRVSKRLQKRDRQARHNCPPSLSGPPQSERRAL
ncbi:hypothetical protein AJ87_38580 [Rhizobium yanglingense]|nr:hypothetical protein AJ87_38580 [Rhizobium yanglingense]